MPHMGSQVPGVHLRIRQRAKFIREAMPLKEPTMAAISNAKTEVSNAARAAKHAANQAARAAKKAKAPKAKAHVSPKRVPPRPLAANPALEALLKKEAAAKALQARLQKEAEIAATKRRELWAKLDAREVSRREAQEASRLAMEAERQAKLQKQQQVLEVRLQDLQSDTCPLEWGHRIREAVILADEAYSAGCKELSHKAKGLVRHLNIVGA